MSKIAAFFDIDGTLYRETLMSELFKKFITHELVSEEKWTDEVKPAFMKWDRRQGDYDSYMQKIVQIFKETTLGLSKEHVEHIARLVIMQKGDRLYQFTRSRIAYHKENGHIIIAISGAPIELVSEMAKKHGFDDYRGSVYEIDNNGIYTGNNFPMGDSESKNKEVSSLVEQYDIDLSKSYAYGDTAGDYLMLSRVGHPFVINPTKELINRIKSNEKLLNKATVIVERKDVIYRIDPNTIDLL
ncbi:MAG: HAD-IB family hydrolase [Erysipelotrichaceae bacterium]|nr:HAD-IB family hydrolase [Erysipelotrichaceae bacterium]